MRPAAAGLCWIWLLADTLNGLMAIPNLVSLLLLSPVVVALIWKWILQREGLLAV